MLTVTVVLSAMAFLAGLPFPIAAGLDNPYAAYGIIYVSMPAWAIGVIAGTTGGFLAQGRAAKSRRMRWIGGSMALLNAAAICLVIIVPFHAS